jgi:D-ribose pyranose/furanose isomerase RbsD
MSVVGIKLDPTLVTISVPILDMVRFEFETKALDDVSPVTRFTVPIVAEPDPADIFVTSNVPAVINTLDKFALETSVEDTSVPMLAVPADIFVTSNVPVVINTLDKFALETSVEDIVCPVTIPLTFKF